MTAPASETGYRTDLLASRISGMAGGPAEEAFERWQASRGNMLGRQYLRTGYDRTDTSTGILATLPLVERYRPDYISIGGHWWEVQGCGHEQVVRFKREKLEVLWSHYAHFGESGRQVRFFIYDMANDKAYVMPIQAVLWAVHHPDARYDEELLDGHKDGWEVPLSLFKHRLVLDALGYSKQVTRKAREEREKADAKAASLTVRQLRAAGVKLGGDAA